MHLLAKNTYGGTGSLGIGISKTDVVGQIRTIVKNDIVGLDTEFDKKYEFYIGIHIKPIQKLII